MRFGLPERSGAQRAHGQRQADYIDQYARGTDARQLAILLNTLGLTGEDPKVLGGNHPDKVKKARRRQARGEGAGASDDVVVLPIHKAKGRFAYVSAAENCEALEEVEKALAYKKKYQLSMPEAAKALGYSKTKSEQAQYVCELLTKPFYGAGVERL